MLRKTATALVLALGLLAPVGTALAEGAGHGAHGSVSLHDIVTLQNVRNDEGELVEADLDTYSFYAAVLNFALLLLVLRKLGKQPLAAFLSGRRDELEQGIKEASAAKAKAEAKYREYSERLERLDDELKKLKNDIETAASSERERILAEAQQSAARADADTRALIELQAKQLGANVRRELVSAAVQSAQQVLQAALKAEDHKRIADNYVKAMSDLEQEKRA